MPEYHLPVPLTPIVGRGKEIAAGRGWLQKAARPEGPGARLLTLTGAPGIGKTRLALEVAAGLVTDFADGVWLVFLAPISDPALVISTIAQALGLKESGGRPLRLLLQDYLRARELLLVLDNFEQVIEAAPLIAELLAAAPQVKILVTSREALRVRGEQELAVPPLDLPDMGRLPSAAQIADCAAVQLFAQRAMAANADFQITDENAPVISAICWRLDGLPLAIELAAARVKLLPPQALFARLGHRLNVLTGGARDLPPRHRTLLSAIAWSYDLLDEDEQTLFRRLGVFVGGGTLDVVEAVCAADAAHPLPVLDGLTSLVNKSLLKQTAAAGDPRFHMLETLREYARQKLAESGEGAKVAQAHARTFLELAHRLAAELLGAAQVPALARLEEEHDNLRAALRWSLYTESEAALGLPLAAALGQFWYIRGYLSEGREWLTTLLVAPNTQSRTAVRAEALRAAGQIAYVQSDYRATQICLEESLAIRRELNDQRGVAAALEQLGEAATEQGDYVSAPQLFAESIAIRRALEDQAGTASVLMNEGWIGLRTGAYTQAVGPLEESLALYRQTGDLDGTAWALAGLGEVAFRQGDLPRALALHEESLKLRRELGHKWGTAISLAGLGWVALRQGNRERAIELIGESMGIRLEMGDKGGLAWCLERLAEIAGTQQERDRAACLLGAAQTVRTGIGSIVDPGDQQAHAHTIATLRSQLGDVAFAQAWAAGERLTLEEAVAYARDASPPGVQDGHSRAPSGTQGQGLTPREGEVVALIAQSKSNAEIAAALVLSKRTVETHIGNILGKLGYTSRGQIAAWAITHGWGDGTP